MNSLGPFREEDSLKDLSLELTSHKEWVERIRSKGNSPEDWVEFIQYLKEQSSLPYEAFWTRYICDIYVSALKTIPSSLSKGNVMFVKLLVDYATLKGEENADDGQTLFSQARAIAGKFAIAYIYAAEFELKQDNASKCRKILDKALRFGAEPRDLLQKALTNLDAGKTHLLTAAEKATCFDKKNNRINEKLPKKNSTCLPEGSTKNKFLASVINSQQSLISHVKPPSQATPETAQKKETAPGSNEKWVSGSILSLSEKWDTFNQFPSVDLRFSNIHDRRVSSLHIPFDRRMSSIHAVADRRLSNIQAASLGQCSGSERAPSLGLHRTPICENPPQQQRGSNEDSSASKFLRGNSMPRRVKIEEFKIYDSSDDEEDNTMNSFGPKMSSVLSGRSLIPKCQAAVIDEKDEPATSVPPRVKDNQIKPGSSVKAESVSKAKYSEIKEEKECSPLAMPSFSFAPMRNKGVTSCLSSLSNKPSQPVLTELEHPQLSSAGSALYKTPISKPASKMNDNFIVPESHCMPLATTKSKEVAPTKAQSCCFGTHKDQVHPDTPRTGTVVSPPLSTYNKENVNVLSVGQFGPKATLDGIIKAASPSDCDKSLSSETLSNKLSQPVPTEPEHPQLTSAGSALYKTPISMPASKMSDNFIVPESRCMPLAATKSKEVAPTKAQSCCFGTHKDKVHPDTPRPGTVVSPPLSTYNKENVNVLSVGQFGPEATLDGTIKAASPLDCDKSLPSETLRPCITVVRQGDDDTIQQEYLPQYTKQADALPMSSTLPTSKENVCAVSSLKTKEQISSSLGMHAVTPYSKDEARKIGIDNIPSVMPVNSSVMPVNTPVPKPSELCDKENHILYGVTPSRIRSKLDPSPLPNVLKSPCQGETPLLERPKPQPLQERSKVRDHLHSLHEKPQTPYHRPQPRQQIPPHLQDQRQIQQNKAQILERPRVLEEMHNISEKRPKVLEERPKVLEERPKVLEERPKVLEERPKVLEEMHNISEKRPKVLEERPKVLEERPKVHEERPKVLEKHNISEKKPKVLEEKHSIPEKKPKVPEERPRPMVEKPQLQEVRAQPQGDDPLKTSKPSNNLGPEEPRSQKEKRPPISQNKPEKVASSSAPNRPSTYTVSLNQPIQGKKLRPLSVNGKTYMILKMVGRGGTSKVYQVFDQSNNTLAVKHIDFEGANEATIQSYMNEITLLTRLQYSDRVIKLHDYELDLVENCLYLVLECGDTDLATMFRHRNEKDEVPREMVKFYWAEMLRAVQVLHKEGIIHSDLKPANFLIVGGHLKLIDFGISGVVQNDRTSMTRETQMGTLNYMSPETILESQADSSSHRHKYKISVKSDVWSLGCMLYNMVYSKTPFQHITNIAQKLHAITNSRFQIPFSDVDDDRLLDTMKLCLCRDPKDRPNIGDLLQHPYLTDQNKTAPVEQKADVPDSNMDNLMANVRSIFNEMAAANVASPKTMKTLSQTLLQRLGVKDDFISQPPFTKGMTESKENESMKPSCKNDPKPIACNGGVKEMRTPLLSLNLGDLKRTNP